MGPNDDDNDDELSEEAGEWEQHQAALFEAIEEFQEEHDVNDSAMSLLLADLAANKRMMGYALEVEQPSGTGLKLELDRFRRELDDLFRELKKNADEFVSQAKKLIEQVAREEAEHEEDEEP
jgi:hypothetical protein